MSATYPEASTTAPGSWQRNEARDRAILAIARKAHRSGALFPTRTALANAIGCARNGVDRAVHRLVKEQRLSLRRCGKPGRLLAVERVAP